MSQGLRDGPQAGQVGSGAGGTPQAGRPQSPTGNAAHGHQSRRHAAESGAFPVEALRPWRHWRTPQPHEDLVSQSLIPAEVGAPAEMRMG